MEATSAPPSLPEKIRVLLQADSPAELRDLLAAADAPEIADGFYSFNRGEWPGLVGLMSVEMAAAVIRELDLSATEALLEDLEPERLRDLIACMEPDDAADLVGLMEQERAEVLLNLLDPQARADISFLLTYPEDSAGGIMDPDVARIRENQTVAEAVAEVRRYVDSVQLNDFFPCSS